MRQDDKRAEREEKRIVKKDGNRNRRRHLQRELDKNPETAHEAEYEFTYDSSVPLNKKPPQKSTTDPETVNTSLAAEEVIKEE